MRPSRCPPSRPTSRLTSHLLSLAWLICPRLFPLHPCGRLPISIIFPHVGSFAGFLDYFLLFIYSSSSFRYWTLHLLRLIGWICCFSGHYHGLCSITGNLSAGITADIVMVMDIVTNWSCFYQFIFIVADGIYTVYLVNLSGYLLFTLHWIEVCNTSCRFWWMSLCCEYNPQCDLLIICYHPTHEEPVHCGVERWCWMK